MKIAFLVHDYHRSGGHSRYVAELATRFAGEHEVHVFANRIDASGDATIRFHHVPAWRANALTTVLSFIFPVTVQVGSGFDIVHSQGFCGLRGNVFTAHICNRAWHQGLESLEGGATRNETIFNTIATALEHGLYRFARHARVIAISQRVAQDLVKFYHCRAPIEVIHHGVDLDLFSPANRARLRSDARAQYGIAGPEMIYLYVGDLRKGARRAIQALSKCPQGRLLLVSRSRTAPYQSYAEECGVADRVIFGGPTNQVERAYAAADAFVLPTPYDAFAMVVTEAMAAGLPVIVSRQAGASELIEPGANGLVIDAGDVEALAQGMQALEQDRPYAMRLGCAARRSVEGLTWDRVATDTMAVYRGLLAS
jgi:UDP-glucose:(heptosyl)LPS alpha-1,3-glucosyltransferase